MKKVFVLFILVIFQSAAVYSQSLDINYSKSNLLYSDFTQMFNKRAGAFHTQNMEYGGQFAWLPIGNQRSIVYYSTEDKYQETFGLRGDWIVSEGWDSTPQPGIVDNYFVRTQSAYVNLNGQWHDITSKFKDGPKPYAIQNLPSTDYALYVVADVIQYRNGVEIAKSSFIWYVHYSAPQTTDTLFVGRQLGLRQYEEYIAYKYHDFTQPVSKATQSQVSCHGLGYACWQIDSSGNVRGVPHYWNW